MTLRRTLVVTPWIVNIGAINIVGYKRALPYCDAMIDEGDAPIPGIGALIVGSEYSLKLIFMT